MKHFYRIKGEAILTAVLLAAALLALLALSVARAEEAAPAAPALTVDLTGIVTAVLLAGFEALLGWAARKLLPPFRKWLEARTTEKQRRMLWEATAQLVDAAEQIIRQSGAGVQKLAYVKAGLQARGFTVDGDMIEAAVKRMKDRAALALESALEISGTTELTVEDGNEE